MRSLAGVEKKKQKDIGSVLQNRKIHSVAIQGMGRLGSHLLQELKESDITVKYVIDRKKRDNGPDIACLHIG